MRIDRRMYGIGAVVAAAALLFGGCAYEYGPDGEGGGPEPPENPEEPGDPPGTTVPPPLPNNLTEALEQVRTADAKIRELTEYVLLAGGAMETAATAFEANLEAAEATGSLAALETAVAAGLLAIQDADKAAVGGDEIGNNLLIIATVSTQTVGLLRGDPTGRDMAAQILVLAADAETSADEAFEAIDVALGGAEVLIEELEGAVGVAEDLGSDVYAAELGAEVALAEAAAALLEGAEGAIEAGEGAVDAAVLALEEVLATL